MTGLTRAAMEPGGTSYPIFGHFPFDVASPLFLMVVDPRRLGLRLTDGLWLRLVDTEAAPFQEKQAIWSDGRWPWLAGPVDETWIWPSAIIRIRKFSPAGWHESKPSR